MIAVAMLSPSDPEYPIIFNTFRVRDPFIFVDSVSQKYYLHAHARDGFYPSATRLDIGVYESKDLYNWKKTGISFSPDANFWGKANAWAPDLYLYKGKYYMFSSYSGSNGIRGAAILVSDKPEGPFMPLINAPITPPEMQALDAVLWVDDAGQPWLVYSHEWTRATNSDGTIVAQKLTDDLKAAADQPVKLFAGSDGPWVRRRNIYVTDAPFLYKASNGDLIMLWSSFIDVSGPEVEHYAIGVARSKSGNILGPWTHESISLNPDDNGGHAMIFRDLNGELRISYHSPNTPSGTERMAIYTVLDNNGILSIKF
jgi:beta-xylosidase